MEVPAELKNAFESLKLDDLAIRHMIGRLLDEQKALAIKARDVWAEARIVMNLPEGEYQYHEGRVTAAIPPMETPNV